MLKRIYSKNLFLLIILVLFMFFLSAESVSTNLPTGVSQVVSDSDGKVLGTYIDVSTSFDICLYDDFRRVVNSRNDQIFIPSNTSEEWSAFLSETPSGVALNSISCCVDDHCDSVISDFNACSGSQKCKTETFYGCSNGECVASGSELVSCESCGTNTTSGYNYCNADGKRCKTHTTWSCSEGACSSSVSYVDCVSCVCDSPVCSNGVCVGCGALVCYNDACCSVTDWVNTDEYKCSSEGVRQRKQTRTEGCGGVTTRWIDYPCSLKEQVCVDEGVCCTPSSWINTDEYRCSSGVRQRKQTRTESCGGDTEQWVNDLCAAGQSCINEGECCTRLTCNSPLASLEAANNGYNCGHFLSDGCGGTLNCNDMCGANKVCTPGKLGDDCSQGKLYNCEVLANKGHCVQDTGCNPVIHVEGYKSWGRIFCINNLVHETVSSACFASAFSVDGGDVYYRDNVCFVGISVQLSCSHSIYQTSEYYQISDGKTWGLAYSGKPYPNEFSASQCPTGGTGGGGGSGPCPIEDPDCGYDHDEYTQQ